MWCLLSNVSVVFVFRLCRFKFELFVRFWLVLFVFVKLLLSILGFCLLEKFCGMLWIILFRLVKFFCWICLLLMVIIGEGVVLLWMWVLVIVMVCRLVGVGVLVLVDLVVGVLVGVCVVGVLFGLFVLVDVFWVVVCLLMLVVVMSKVMEMVLCNVCVFIVCFLFFFGFGLFFLLF